MATCPTCRNAFAAGTFCPADGARLVDEMDGSVVLDKRYRLLRKVGVGGMGEVYEAEHIHIHRKVAVKILKPEIASDAEAIARLQREAQTTSGLGHPNIVDTFDFGHAEGQAYLVMEWLDGENLDQRLTRGPIDVATALEIGAQAAAGLAEAHARGVIHRDVKPGNLFLTTDRRGALVVKIVDFGIAKLAAAQVALTATGVLIGTPNYMAPEQAMGELIDARTDIYALGVILYEMITGVPPFRGDTPLAVLHQHTSKAPLPPSESAAALGISSDVEAVILRCLRKRPHERFETMKDLVHALDDIRGLGNSAQPSLPLHANSLPEVMAEPRAPTIAPLTGVVRAETDLSSRSSPATDLGDDDDAMLAAARSRPGRMLWIGCGLVAALAAVVIAFALLRTERAQSRERTGTRDAALPDATVADATAATSDASVDIIADAWLDTAISTGPPDAAAAPDPESAVVWRHDARGRRFAVRATSSTRPVAGAPFDLVVDFADLPGSVSSPRVAVSIEYFQDHAVIHTSSHELVRDRRFRAAIITTRPGKHHVRIDLFDHDRKLDTVRFDITFEVAR